MFDVLSSADGVTAGPLIGGLLIAFGFEFVNGFHDTATLNGVALALGLGTMAGWKRIVVTVGEKIGATPMSNARGAAAQVVTSAAILAAGPSTSAGRAPCRRE